MKNALIILIIFVGVSTFLLNQSLFAVQSKGGRSPASVQKRSLSQESQIVLAQKIATLQNRVLASIGKQPNQLDDLRFGVLEGKYALSMSGEKIKNIEFINTPDSEGRPKQVADRLEFLKKYANLLNIKPVDLEKLNTDIVGRKIIETFKAIAVDSNREVKIKIELDELDQLYKVSSVEIGQVF